MGQKTSVSKEIVNESFKRRVIEEYLAGGVTKESLLKKYNIRYGIKKKLWKSYSEKYSQEHSQTTK